MATREVEPQEDLPRSEWNGLESTEHTDFNNTTSTTYASDITTASSITTTNTSNSSKITALDPTTADSDSDSDSDSATIIAGTPTTTDTAFTTATTTAAAAAAATTTDLATTNPTTTTTTTSDLTTDTSTTTSDLTTTSSTSTSTTTISSSDLTTTTTHTTTTTTLMTADDDQTDEEQSDDLYIENATSTESDLTAGSEDHVTSTPTHLRPVPPSSLALSGSRPRKRKILVAPALSLSLGHSDSVVSEDFPPAFLSPSSNLEYDTTLDDQEDDPTLDIDLDAMETPSDSESLHFPSYDLDLEEEFRRLGVSSHQQRSGSSPRPRRSRGFGSESTAGLGCLDREDTVDSEGTRWRSFSVGEPSQEGKVNMSVVEPYLRVLSHGGYYGDGMNDIIVFSSCYLPENSLDNYDYVMDNLFRYVVGTLDLMVAESYVIVYLCAGAQKERLPGISWLRECYTTVHRRLRKNLKGLYVVHPTWFIKAMITIIKPFISSKFSRKLQFVDSLQELSQLIPTEHVQIPDSVRQFDENLNR